MSSLFFLPCTNLRLHRFAASHKTNLQQVPQQPREPSIPLPVGINVQRGKWMRGWENRVGAGHHFRAAGLFARKPRDQMIEQGDALAGAGRGLSCEARPIRPKKKGRILRPGPLLAP